ncbi:MAG: Thivi_2564 family membrane protein [Ferrovum myxofaciens]|jgi:Flp pilus assembly protein TadB|nr:Thivi_2564 family membrane protein [Ferrovum myxofaciens]
MQIDAIQGGDMPLVQLVIILIVVGVVLWLINTYIPMEVTIKKILNAVVIIAVILWLLSVFGLLNSLSGIRVGR